MHDLDHPISCRCKNADSWQAKKGDLQRVFPLYVLMVPSSALTVAADGDPLMCGGFSLSEPICLGRFKFIADYFGGSSLSPRRGDSDPAFMGKTHNGTLSTRWAMIEDSTEEFLMVSSGRGASASPPTGGATRGLRPLPSQPHHGWRMLWPLMPC
jgi:hypothetical protein